MKSYFSMFLPNGKQRHTGRYHTIEFCIDSKTPKTEEQIEKILDNYSVDFLVNNERYIIDITATP